MPRLALLRALWRAYSNKCAPDDLETCPVQGYEVPHQKQIPPSKKHAIAEFAPFLDPDICATCFARTFRESALCPGRGLVGHSPAVVSQSEGA